MIDINEVQLYHFYKLCKTWNRKQRNHSCALLLHVSKRFGFVLFFGFFFKLQKKKTCNSPHSLCFSLPLLSFSITIQFLLPCSNRGLLRLLKFFHSVILDGDRNEFQWPFHARSKPGSYCSPRHSAAALPQVQHQQHLLEGQLHLARMSWWWQQTTVSLQHPPLISVKGRADSYAPLLSTQDFEKESCSSPMPFVWLKYLWADVPQGSNKTGRKIALVIMQLSSTSINQLLAHHHSYILPHQSAVLIPGSLHSPRHTVHPRKALPQATCPAINPLLMAELVKPSVWSGFPS